MDQRQITPEDIYRFEPIFNPRLSPDGEHVIYSQQWVDREKKKKPMQDKSL